MVIKIIATFILLLYLNNISFACSFNCGGTYKKNDEYGLKTTSHSGYKKHAFYYMPKKTKPIPPSKRYLNLIIQGYKDCGYRNNYIVISKNKKIKAEIKRCNKNELLFSIFLSILSAPKSSYKASYKGLK